MAEADLEDALGSWLADHDLAEEWLLAPPLAAAGADLEWCERLAEVVPGALLGPGVDWVASAQSMDGLLAEVKESTGRISGLVARVRSYTQLDRASLQSTDIPEGLDSTLVMLNHKIGHGVVVERDYSPEVPRIDAMAAELNQVWTNLIDNAVDAMDGVGTLRITTRAEPDAVVVEIADSGPGLDPAVAARAFDAFYTTKDVGKGTGLGLDTARRIVVENHEGTIALVREGDETVVRVRLPR